MRNLINLLFGKPKKNNTVSFISDTKSKDLKNKIVEAALSKESVIRKLFPNPNRTENRGGVDYHYWQDRRGNDIIMRRSSDKGGYIQLPDRDGEIFAVVWINPTWSHEEGNETIYEADYLFPFAETTTKLNWFNRNF